MARAQKFSKEQREESGKEKEEKSDLWLWPLWTGYHVPHPTRLHPSLPFPPSYRYSSPNLSPGPYLDVLDKDYSKALEGTGFYQLVACANHSCRPNCESLKGEDDLDGRALLRAKRRIAAGAGQRTTQQRRGCSELI